MQKFHDYGVLEQQIHVPEELKARVLQAARESRGHTLRLETAPAEKTQRKTGRYSRGFSLVQRAAVIAILLVCVPVTAYAAVKYSGLADFLKEIGMENTKIEELVETYPSEAAVTPTVSDALEAGALTPPEFSVAEAACDDHSLYLTVRVKPQDDRYLLVPSDLGIADDVSNLQIPGVSGQTIAAYAREQGKELLIVSARPDNANKYGVSTGAISKCEADGTVCLYFLGENPSGLKEFDLTINCHYHTMDKAVDERFSFDVTVKNKSTSSQVREFTQFEDTGLGLTIHSITIEETELGFYARFTYTPTDGKEYGISLVDAEGNFFMGIPGSGGPLCEANGDGTYSCEESYRELGDLDSLQFSVLRTDDFERFGPFKILG